jgi:hypothetical protein
MKSTNSILVWPFWLCCSVTFKKGLRHTCKQKQTGNYEIIVFI